MNEEKPIEQVTEQIIGKLSFKKKFWETIKKILLVLTVFIIVYRLLKWTLNNIRKSWKLQLDDDDWGTIIWIKFWRIVYGLVGGILLQYYFSIFTKVENWIEFALDVIR